MQKYTLKLLTDLMVFFWKIRPFPVSFFFFCLLNTVYCKPQLVVNNIAHDWIRTTDLWYWKCLLNQKSHKKTDSPSRILFAQNDSANRNKNHPNSCLLWFGLKRERERVWVRKEKIESFIWNVSWILPFSSSCTIFSQTPFLLSQVRMFYCFCLVGEIFTIQVVGSSTLKKQNVLVFCLHLWPMLCSNYDYKVQL